MQEKNETFTYTYSAKDREELRRIRDKYLPPAETPLDQLRRIDRRVTRKSTAVAVTVGLAGTLALGVGMCCTMVWTNLFAPGIVIGLLGIAAIAAALPMYNRTAKKEREKHAPEVLKLTESLGKAR